MPHQAGILADVPPVSRYLTFRKKPEVDPKAALRALANAVDPAAHVTGFGASLVSALGASIDGLREFPSLTGPSIDVPATPDALWLWLRGEDRGTLLHEGRRLGAVVGEAFELSSAVDAFRYREGRDLTGYVDGTENPTGAEAQAAGVARDGSSFVAVQRWIHDLPHFLAKSPLERDHVIGRSLVSNEELDDAPKSAHVKRTAQESFEPEAFVVRRSMPYTTADEAGLVFVAFGHSLDAFEKILRRMVGEDDGVTDALFSFSRPATGAYFWCPPVLDGKIDLRAFRL